MTCAMLTTTSRQLPLCVLQQGSPASGLQTITGLWLARRWDSQQEVSITQVSEASSAFTALPITGVSTCTPPPSDQWWRNRCHVHESAWSHPSLTPVGGNILLHETGHWCQKDWGLLFHKSVQFWHHPAGLSTDSTEKGPVSQDCFQIRYESQILGAIHPPDQWAINLENSHYLPAILIIHWNDSYNSGKCYHHCVI